MPDDVVRVICFLPVEVNQLLQAKASLEGISKQQLIADVVTQFANKLNIRNERKTGVSK